MNKPKVVTKEDAVEAMVKTTDKDLRMACRGCARREQGAVLAGHT